MLSDAQNLSDSVMEHPRLVNPSEKGHVRGLEQRVENLVRPFFIKTGGHTGKAGDGQPQPIQILGKLLSTRDGHPVQSRT